MSREHPARELAGLQQARDRVATNLVELEIDSSRQLLEVSTLTGRSAGLLERMSKAFDEVKTVVARFGETWGALTPRVTAAQTAADETQALAAELDEIASLARSGAWRDARHRLDAWTSRTDALIDQARQAVRANRAPIEARNQFRALLEAYQVKAERLGVVEDPELEHIFARTHEALYTAPTDLALVAQLVRRYQERITSVASVQETRR